MIHAEEQLRLRERLGSAVATDYAGAPEQTFEHGLQVLLGGLEAERATAADRPAARA
jgi:hypothetical protein